MPSVMAVSISARRRTDEDDDGLTHTSTVVLVRRRHRHCNAASLRHIFVIETPGARESRLLHAMQYFASCCLWGSCRSSRAKDSLADMRMRQDDPNGVLLVSHGGGRSVKLVCEVHTCIEYKVRYVSSSLVLGRQKSFGHHLLYPTAHTYRHSNARCCATIGNNRSVSTASRSTGQASLGASSSLKCIQSGDAVLAM